jgi:PilX N-terminal
VALKRTDERGAALFVVVLVISLLTAIGVFAMHATSLAQLSSGYSRRAASAFYLAELAANLRVATIADDPSSYVAMNSPGQCYASKELTPLLPTNTIDFCVPMEATDAIRMANADNTGISTDPEGFFGALNRPDVPSDQATNAMIRVEATDHHPPPKPLQGFQIAGNMQIVQDTLTVSAALVPLTTTAGQCTAAVMRSSERQWLRGYVTYVQSGPPTMGAR